MKNDLSFLINSEMHLYEHQSTAININYGHNESLQKKCKALYDYGVYINEIRKGVENKKSLDKAVDEALDYVIEQKLLEGFFKEHKAEVKMVSLTEFDQELYDRCRRREGAQEKAIEAATKLLKMKVVTPEQIAEAEDLPLEKVLELKAQLEVTKA